MWAVTITAAADGSALGNPGPAGWAWYVDPEHWGAGGWALSTNNRGELQAVLELFRATAHLDDDLLVQCDSQYAINCVTKWMPGWKASRWRKRDGSPVLNVDILEQLDEEIRGRRYRFEWVRGHSGHELNEAADERARAAAESYQRGVLAPTGPGWSSVPAPGASAPPVAAALFDLDDPDPVEVVLELTPDQHERLRVRAHDSGVSPEEWLRAQI